MSIRLIPAIGTKYSLAKGLGTQYRDVSENEGFHFMVLSVRGSRAVKLGVSGVDPLGQIQPILVQLSDFGYTWLTE